MIKSVCVNGPSAQVINSQLLWLALNRLHLLEAARLLSQLIIQQVEVIY